MKSGTLLFGCVLAAFQILPSSAAETAAGAEKVHVRVSNASSAPMSAIKIGFGSRPPAWLEIGFLAPGTSSAYREVSGAWEAVPASFRIFGQEYRVQIIDRSGEKPLPPGRYTYVLNFQGGLLGSLDLIVEGAVE